MCIAVGEGASATPGAVRRRRGSRDGKWRRRRAEPRPAPSPPPLTLLYPLEWPPPLYTWLYEQLP